MNAAELIVATRELIDELKPHDFGDDTILGYLNREQEARAASILVSQPSLLSRFVDVDFTNGTDIGSGRVIDWPENLVGADSLEDIRAPNSPIPIEPIHLKDRWSATRLSWFAFHKKLGLTPVFHANVPVRVWGAFLPPRLTVGTFPVSQASGDSVATLQAGTPQLSLQNDHYNGTQIEVITGAAAGTRRTIRDYVGSTRQITIEGTWGTALTTDDRYAMVPALPDPHTEVLAFGAALRASFREANKDILTMIAGQHGQMVLRLDTSFSMAKGSRPRRVRDLGWVKTP